jgi:hypothetical protein
LAAASATLGDRVVIHPLTRVGVDSAGRPAIMLHLEVLDRFGQSIKALGELEVRLLARGGLSDDRDQVADLASGTAERWLVDLREARDNARAFDDRVTRTYTIPLGGPPAWVVAWSKEPLPSDARASARTGPQLQAAMLVEDERGRPKLLRASARLMR